MADRDGLQIILDQLNRRFDDNRLEFHNDISDLKEIVSELSESMDINFSDIYGKINEIKSFEWKLIGGGIALGSLFSFIVAVTTIYYMMPKQ